MFLQLLKAEKKELLTSGKNLLIFNQQFMKK